MKSEYLGDSFDVIKRLWQELLAEWAPLYATPRFIPKELRQDFTKLTRIPMLADNPTAAYSILNDPDTGIRLPGEQNQAEGRKHITIKSIVKQLQNSNIRCVITFDQSDYRNIGLKRDKQRLVKMRRIAEKGFHSFYYVSHAPFLFALPDVDALSQVQRILKNSGIPENRFECHK